MIGCICWICTLDLSALPLSFLAAWLLRVLACSLSSIRLFICSRLSLLYRRPAISPHVAWPPGTRRVVAGLALSSVLDQPHRLGAPPIKTEAYL